MSNIKIQDVYQRIQYSATSLQTAFAIPFPFFENSDIVAYQNETLLVLTTDYTLSGAGSPSGGTLTLVTGATEFDIITIQGMMPIDRTSIYSATISNLTGSDLNQDFNREVVMMKQIETTQKILQLQYSPYLEVSQDDTVTRDRWLPILGASQVWAMNPAGTAIIAVDFDNTADAPADAKYFLAEADGQLINGVDFGALTSGLLKHTVAAGVSTPATAINAVDYWAPGDDLTRSSAPTVGSDVTNKTYVDALASGLNFLLPVLAASTADFTSTYDNGASGIGATLTATGNGAFTLDGEAGVLDGRYLIKDQTNSFENGVYILSQVGTAGTPAILTRSTDFDEPSEIEPGDLVLVINGTANQETFWIQTATVTTIGTDAIDFNLFGLNPADMMTLSTVQTATGAKTFNSLTLGGAMDANSQNINDVATITIQDAIQHSGDTNNQVVFGTDTQDYQTGGSSRLDISDSGVRLGGANTRVTTILDEDNMVSDSATALATQQSIKAYVDAQISGSSDWVLLATNTAAASATLDFTGISSTYFAYAFVIDYIHPATDGVNFSIRTSTDGGSTYDNGASDYQYSLIEQGASYVQTLSSAATEIVLATNVGNTAATESAHGVIYLINPSAAQWATVIGQIYSRKSTSAATIYDLYGQRATLADVDAIRFFFSSGNLDEGIIKMYGIKA